MGLTIVTHTAGNRPDLLARSVASVEAQLPIGAKHRIIQTSNFAEARIASLDLDDYVAFVDDDDLVVNNSLNVCYDLITASDASLVFTIEQQIDMDDKFITANHYASVRYKSIAQTHFVAHHLAMFRTATIVDTRDMWQEYQSNVCWMIKSEAGLKGGAIYAPFVGYQWRRHRNGMSQHIPFRAGVEPLTRLMSTWLPPSFPEYIPKASLA